MAESEQFLKGLEVRRAVLGTEYVDGGFAKADDFMMAFQRITTEWWGRCNCWSAEAVGESASPKFCAWHSIRRAAASSASATCRQ